MRVKQSQAMKSASLLLIFLGFFYFIQSQEVKLNDKVCVGGQECCKSEDVNGVATCTQICDPVVPCEVFVPIGTRISGVGVSSGLSSICSVGFRLDSRGKFWHYLRAQKCLT